MAGASLISEAAPRRRQARQLVWSLVRRRKGLFFAAVAGASCYALATVLSSVVIRLVTDDVIIPRFDEGHVDTGTVVRVLALLIGVGVLRALAVVVRRTRGGRLIWLTTHDITDDVVHRLAEQPVPWHRRQVTGDLITRAGVDAEAATAVLFPLPFACGVIMQLALSALWLLITDVWLGLLALGIIPLLIAGNVVYQRHVGGHFDEAQRQLGALSAAAHESFDGVTVVKAFGAEERATSRLAEIAGRVRGARLRVVDVRSTFESLLDGVPTLVNLLLLTVGAFRVRAGSMSVGELTGFVYLFGLLVLPLRMIGYVMSELPRSVAGWNRVRRVLDEPVVPDPASGRHRSAPRSGEVGVELDDVWYEHVSEPSEPGAGSSTVGRAVLRGVDLRVRAGRTLVLTGATGAGKTTLLHVVAGLVAPERGSVAVASGSVALVSQEAFLLASSVRENVTLGAPYDDEAVWRALDLAEAGFVRDLPDGLDTRIGERGVGLSGGQRQRVALARAFIRHPTVLLLDDTTSALDPTTEAKVLDNMRHGLGATTVIAVASRPSTIALADEVALLADGRIAAAGTHAQLLSDVPAYRELVEAFEQARTGEGGFGDEVVPADGARR